MALNTGKFLREDLFHSARDLRLGWSFSFQQDSDTKHPAKAKLEGFKEKHLSGMEWLSPSPDVNPIENT